MSDTNHVRLEGIISPGIRWFEGKWSRICEAHRGEFPEIDELTPGTLNIELTNPIVWAPPNDEELRVLARRDGLKRQIAFRINGNYVHPTCRVVELAGHPIEAWLYYPGLRAEVWPHDSHGLPQPILRNRLELISRVHLRTQIPSLTDGTHVAVKVEFSD